MAENSPAWNIRPAYKGEWQEAMSLAWKTFLKFEAGDYTQEGIESFRNFITDNTLYRMFLLGSYELVVAMDGPRMVGMVSLRQNSHISLLFVDEDYHRHGIGRALINYLCNYLLTEVGISRITVNAAPYGVGFYHKLGFRDTGLEIYQDGIRYTPMEFVL